MSQNATSTNTDEQAPPDDPVGAPLTAPGVPDLADVHRPGQEPGGDADEGPVHMAVPAETKKKGRS